MRAVGGPDHGRWDVSSIDAREGALVVRLADRTLSLRRTGDAFALTVGDATHTLHRAADADVRRFEKLDEKALLADPTLCDRARRCCAALLAKNTTAASDCDALVSVPEIGRCDRALRAFAAKVGDDADLRAACAR